MAIVLLSDFGSSDSYAGVLKGVLARLAPEAQVLDLCHDLPPFDLNQANLVLFQAYAYFPKNSIFVVVVDPGVGSERRPILIETETYFFVGPDNGVFTLALSEQKVKRVIHLSEPKYFLGPVSATFHGRDIFAPVAAHLSKGIAAEEFGPALPDYHRLKGLEPEILHDHIVGKILGIDRFGNAITNLKRSYLQKYFPDLHFSVEAGGQPLTSLLRDLHTHYAEGKKGESIMLFGSSNLLEISVNQGSAQEKLDLKTGDPVKIPLSK